VELQSALDVEEIAAVGPGGHLARKYTWQHVRDHVRLQRASQDQYEAWAAGGATLFERTAQKTRELRESDRPTGSNRTLFGSSTSWSRRRGGSGRSARQASGGVLRS